MYLPENQREESHGLQLVAFSRAKGPDCLAVGNNSNNLTIMSIQKIGTSEKNKLRRTFQKKLKDLSVTSQAATVEAIKKLDPIEMDTGKTFKGGCKFLLDWLNPVLLLLLENIKASSLHYLDRLYYYYILFVLLLIDRQL